MGSGILRLGEPSSSGTRFQAVDSGAKARDQVRLSDISTLDRAISEFALDNKRYPDIVDIPRTSTSLPGGNSGPFESAYAGWIDEDLSAYIPKLPVDPINDVSYFYSYQHNATSYELNARLESLEEYMENDGGNNVGLYEIGNNLTLL